MAKLRKNEEAAHWVGQVLENRPSDFLRQSACCELASVCRKLGRLADAQKMLDELKQMKEQPRLGIGSFKEAAARPD